MSTHADNTHPTKDNTTTMINSPILTIQNKSTSDKNSYHLITLPNHLKVLLVSDPQAERYSASLSVKVGSFQDPKNQQGLAHFLEHMLFLGTEKFPEPGNYQSYINTHGGSHNAYTSTDTTNYYFDITPSAYEGALDRFSQFFISPLFSDELAQREKNAVDAEYKAKLKDENRRNNQALKTLTNPDHPYSHFTVGSLETLKDRPGSPLRKQLLTLYKNNYYAENMALVLVANLPYSQLAALAKDYFSGISNHHTPHNDHLPELINSNKTKLQFVRSLIDNNTLNLYYQIDAQGNNYKTQPSRYLSYILGNENKGSLYASLKSEGLISGLSAGISTDYGNHAFFQLKIRLTNDGLTQIETVARRTFATISLLKSSPVNPLYLQEGLKLSQLMFNHQNYVDPQNLARTLSAKMLNVPTEDILSSFRLETAASDQQVQTLLQQLNPDKLLIQLVTDKTFPESWTKKTPTWQIEPWYNSKYSNNNISQSLANIINLSVKNTHVSLPEKNPFIPESLAIVTEQDTEPKIIFEKKGITYWNKSDPSFAKPTAMNFLAIRFDHAADTAKRTLLNRLWTRLFNDSISELTYAPYIAGLGYSFYPHSNGVTLRTSGYSDKQNNYEIWLIDQLFLFRPTLERFNLAKKQLETDLNNQKSRQAYNNANSALNILITKNSFTTEQLKEALDSLTLQDLQAFTKQARDKFDIVGYSTGNTTKEQSIQLAQSIFLRFKDRLISRKPLEIETKPLTPQGRHHYQFPSTSDDCAVLYALIDTSSQTKNKAITEKAYFSILRTLISSPFYQELRTDQQLGYIVGVQDLSIRNTPILGLLVQSPNNDTSTIINAMEDFLTEQRERLPNISTSEFDNAKKALLQQLGREAKNLSDNAIEEWHQIAKPTSPDFQTKEDWIHHVEKIQREDFLEFIKRKLQSKDTAKIIIHNQTFPTTLTEQQSWKETTPTSNNL
ncbi:insulinase family protein [Marinomonas pontica]|uniref:insulinase family protein n=1 Tax=Marinomonas pontica TaxID=264739 RepID=UPI002244943B|nr:insulinase family protein [Marinomonas pontica]MCW8357331.1 insulinase family protein [Marinomonas pontica]